MSTHRFISKGRLALLLTLALLLSAFAASPAFADDSTPPPPDDGTTTVTDTSSTTTDAAPEGTDVVVVSADGESVPLASGEAADSLTGSDPIWCPSGVAPNPATPSCSSDYVGLDDLIADAGFQPTANGVIWVESGTNWAGSIINGAGNWAGSETYSLTIQGGWSGTYGSTALDTPLAGNAYAYTSFSGVNDDYLDITSWVGPVTLKNLVFNSATYAVGSNDYYTLIVSTKGNIVLNNVQVNDSFNSDGTYVGYGAYLSNTGGTGTITVTNSSFTDNEGIGLTVDSKGTVTLKNDVAYSNGFEGVSIDNSGALSPKSVVVSNSSFEENGDHGLAVYSEGTITLTNISANNNGGDGVHLENYYGSTNIAPIYINGVNAFNNNGGNGVLAVSDGLIKVTATTANDNSGSGLELDNSGSYASYGVTIATFLNASDNGGQGLEIYSTGAVTAANVIANNNGNEGIYIENDYWCPGPTFVCLAKNVTFTGYNVFNDNNWEGLYITTIGSVLLNNLTVVDNGYSGNFSGVYIENNDNVTKQSGVTINGYNFIDHNGLNGLEIYSYGVVTLNNIHAVDNGFDTLDEDGANNGQGDGVYIENYGGTYPKAVYIKGVNIFNGNEGDGLYIDSDGAISVSKITANDNQSRGARLTNGASPGQYSVTISGYGVFEHNGSDATGNDPTSLDDGLSVSSNGTITLTNISAYANWGTGANLYTRGLTSVHAVTLLGVNNFNWNGNDTTSESGLVINADGTITVNKITANFNSWRGADLDNYTNWNFNGFSSAGSVYVNGFGVFVGNINDTGLVIESNANVTINRVMAMDNGYRGVSIGYDNDLTVKNVTIVCSYASGNSGFNVDVDATGNLTIKGLLEGDPFSELTVGGTTTVTTCP